MARIKTWALMTNGARARILRGLDAGDAEDPIELVSTGDATHLRDVLSDSPDPRFASRSEGRRPAREDGSDPVLRDMQDVAQETLSVLDRHHRAGRLDRLAIFASSTMLSILHKKMPATLRSAVVQEKAVNLIDLPRAELRKALLETFREEPQA
jgi:protein required for attachment to host cells